MIEGIIEMIEITETPETRGTRGNREVEEAAGEEVEEGEEVGEEVEETDIAMNELDQIQTNHLQIFEGDHFFLVFFKMNKKRAVKIGLIKIVVDLI